MELVTFVLFMAAKVLYIAIVTLLIAIPSGIGLGFGLHAVKKFIAWWGRKKIDTPEQRAEKLKDILTQNELDAIAGAEAN